MDVSHWRPRQFHHFSKLPWEIRREIWKYIIPNYSWKMDKHVECLRDLLSGRDSKSLAKFKEKIPSPYLALSTCNESRRLAFELVKERYDQLQEMYISGRATEYEGQSTLSIDRGGSLVISMDDEYDGPKFDGQRLDKEVFWDWEPKGLPGVAVQIQRNIRSFRADLWGFLTR